MSTQKCKKLSHFTKNCIIAVNKKPEGSLIIAI